MRLIFTGGGTGGHIYPAIALIKALKKEMPNVEILYIGKKNAEEERICLKEKIPFFGIKIFYFHRKMIFKNFKTIYYFLKAYCMVKKIIKKFKPDCIIGTGGYVSSPVVFAGSRLKIKTIIHEQNSIPGLTNKFLARYATKIAISMPSSANYFPEEKVVLTGNPRSQEVTQINRVSKASLGLNENKKLLLIFMGSLGAKYVNETIVKSLPELSTIKDLEIIFVTGKLHYDNINSEIKKNNIGNNVFLKAYIDNLPEYYQHADLVICRGGATTLAEISALGIPAILIPSPYVTNNHQEKNALDIVNHQGGIMIREKELTKEILVKTVKELFNDPYKRQLLKINIKKRGISNSSTRFIELIKQLK